MKKLIFLLLVSISSLTFAGNRDGLVKNKIDSIMLIADAQIDYGLYDIAINQLLVAEKIADSTNSKEKQSQIFAKISQICMFKIQYDKALDYANISLKIAKEIGSYKWIGWAYARIADVKYSLDNYVGAEQNYKSAIQSFDKIGDKKSKSQMINNLGLIYKNQNNLSKAEKCFLEAYVISKEIKYMTFQAYTEEELADNYRMKKDYYNSKKYFDLAMSHEKEANYILLTQNILNGIHNYYKETGDYSKALFYFEKYASLTDSLSLINQNQRILEVETKMRTNEKQKEISFLNKESELQQVQIKKGNTILGLSGVVILVIGGIVIIIYKSRKKLSAKNKEIEHQKKEIVDSINYAKRIQDASLGNPDKIKEFYSNAAILFQPKDILSGDFYWFKKVGQHFMFSAADCTGHGVPGAMMSMIGNNGLNDAVNTKKLNKPSEILNHLSEYVHENFTKTDVDMKDGMDIAFCSLDVETGKLTYAGALNSLYIKKANGEFLEVKSDKNYIGQVGSVYADNVLQLEKDDCVYVMSDGFVDQFGGVNNKKFKTSGFRNLIEEIYKLDIDTQNIKLKEAINTWKSNFEQTDDICLISVKF